MNKYLFTSESVTEGHPDKICDQISDAILDAIMEQDTACRVACETTVTTGIVSIMGEISTSSHVDISQIVRRVVKNIGYVNAEYGFDADGCAIVTSLDGQSEDIALGVDYSLEMKDDSSAEDNLIGAGDQGMMFGYACNETPELMPLPISLAHKLAKQLSDVRKKGVLGYLRPDGKTQVTVEYIDGRPARVDTIIVAAQHSPTVELEQLKEDITAYVIAPVIRASLMDDQTKIYINPTGRFVTGGPKGDSGLTGRKIIVDTYGGYARHGGGAFSGKDPSKVDRSASYMARYIAKNVVAVGIAEKCEVQLAYAIGIAHPVSVMIDTFGTGRYSNEDIIDAVNRVFDMRPSAIIKHLDLLRPIYQKLAVYGHMGREELNVKWEQTDKVDELLFNIKKALNTISVQ